MYIVFVDLKVVYDWILRDVLFKCLEIRLKFLFFVFILCVLYIGMKVYVKGSKYLFDIFVGCC